MGVTTKLEAAFPVIHTAFRYSLLFFFHFSVSFSFYSFGAEQKPIHIISFNKTALPIHPSIHPSHPPYFQGLLDSSSNLATPATEKSFNNSQVPDQQPKADLSRPYETP